MSRTQAPQAAAGSAGDAARPGGTLFYVVGASGVGKDSLIDTLRQRLPAGRFVFARRIITRPADSGGEAHEACTEAQFIARDARGEFLLSWQAHGLRYGLAATLLNDLEAGRHVIANGSRSMAVALAARVARLVVIEIDAPPELIAARLAARGRESDADIAQRLARSRAVYPDTLTVVRVINDGDLSTGTVRFLDAIVSNLGDRSLTSAFDAERVIPMALQAGAPPAARALADKLAGARLDFSQWRTLLQGVVDHQLDTADRNALLIACANDLDDDELGCIARWRCGLMPRVDWGRTPVVDKHSLGGTAGSRVSMVVIPIVAAHGMLIPKTSSRAITSAAGTADAMEVLARVDLDPAELRRTVAQAGGCIAWNGKLNHSVLDESMHRLERLLLLDTRRWSVASILSKKWSAGATHVVVDIPYMPSGKVGSLDDARSLAATFERLGAALGMTVRAYPSDGSLPIGRGIGPALEARDVLQVLEDDPRAPADLRAKALLFAARILALDPAVGDVRRGEARALELLQTGAARRAMQAIIDAQGPSPLANTRGLQLHPVTAERSGRVLSVDARRISALARLAGAPTDSLAGIDLACTRGDTVSAGAVLYSVQAVDGDRLAEAVAAAHAESGVRLG